MIRNGGQCGDRAGNLRDGACCRHKEVSQRSGQDVSAFRYKNENGEWKRKWKQKIMGGDGKVHFIDADPKAYHPGRGVYRSSARNAQRLARTEINMAYRKAEQERWKSFDFVVGYEVKTTQNGRHVEDICDCLAGKYRKDFKFLGWHPMCMCYSIPILKTED